MWVPTYTEPETVTRSRDCPHPIPNKKERKMRIPRESERVWTELEYAYAQAHGMEIPDRVHDKFGGDK